MDANWRWTHAVNRGPNCYDGNTWDTNYCPDPTTCSQNCVLEGITSAEWKDTYGIEFPSGDEIKFVLVNQGQYSRNVGGRVYLLDESGTNYRMFPMLNREFTFTVDDHEMNCGINGALYFVEMEADGGLSKDPLNKAGAAAGTGY